MNVKYQLLIQHGTAVLAPPTVNGVSVEWQMKNQPGKLTFSCVKTAALSISEGDAVSFSVNGKGFFKGYVFTKARTGKDNRIIKITCYDQLYYFKNKDTYVIENKTAASVLRMVCEDFGLKLGVVEPTPYIIKSQVEDNSTLFDIVQNSLDATKKATGRIYTLFDKAGKISLLGDAAMTVSFMINKDSIGDFDYSTTIDGVYNRVKLVQDKSDNAKVDKNRKTFDAQNPLNMKKWGALQYYEKLSGDENGGQAKAQSLLKQNDRKKRSLSIKNVLGDTRIRAGSLLPCMLGLGDMNLSGYMRVEQIQHSFYDNEHTMSMKLIGGDNFV